MTLLRDDTFHRSNKIGTISEGCYEFGRISQPFQVARCPSEQIFFSQTQKSEKRERELSRNHPE